MYAKIEREYFECDKYYAYDVYHLRDGRFQNVALKIESTQLKIQCEVCDHVTNVENYRFLCENCERPSKNVIEGEEMLIHKIEFDD